MPVEKVMFVKEWYESLISKTDEKDLLMSKFKDLLSSKGYSSCLEIGLGTSPYFARNLHMLFDEYTIVEKELYEGELPTNVSLIQGDWEEANISKTYDVIIASHVIYYFDDKRKALEKMMNRLNKDGILIFVVNGSDADYGDLKRKFSKLVREDYLFTYEKLKILIGSYDYTEYTVPSTVSFENEEDLFKTLQISFDMYPKEYQEQKTSLIDYFSKKVNKSGFTVNQKIFVVRKEKSMWGDLINHPDHELKMRGMDLLVNDGVFSPDPTLSHSTSIILDNLPSLKNETVLVIGSGTGSLAIYSALKGAKDVVAVDANPRAVENTRINCEKNSVEGTVNVLQSDLFEGVTGSFDYVLANLPINKEIWDSKPPLELITQFLREARGHVTAEGQVLLTWASFGDVDSVKKILSDYEYKEITEDKLGHKWYLFKVSF